MADKIVWVKTFKYVLEGATAELIDTWEDGVQCRVKEWTPLEYGDKANILSSMSQLYERKKYVAFRIREID